MTHIALLGFGVVGGGVADVLVKNAETITRKTGESIDIRYILDLRDFPDHPLGDRVVHDIGVILDDPEISIVAEMMGGSHPAYEFTYQALQAGKHVVTSNKEVVANFGAELLRVAKENGVRYLFEASVGGGIPVIRPISSCLAANEIFEIDGILNGTTNYIFTRMGQAGLSLSDALSEAQAKGYAERNPAADIEGVDACRKICILSALAFGKSFSPSAVHTEGITAVTKEDVADAEKYGGAVKLIGRTGLLDPENPDSPVFMLVAPHIVPLENPLSNVQDVFNAIMVRGNAVGDVMFYGRGAGNLPTASAVAADMIEILSHKNTDVFTPAWETAEDTALADSSVLPYAFLVRVRTADAYAAAKSALLGAIPDAELLTDEDSFDGRLSFVTPVTTERDCRAVCAGLGELEAMLRILP